MKLGHCGSDFYLTVPVNAESGSFPVLEPKFQKSADVARQLWRLIPSPSGIYSLIQSYYFTQAGGDGRVDLVLDDHGGKNANEAVYLWQRNQDGNNPNQQWYIKMK